MKKKNSLNIPPKVIYSHFKISYENFKNSKMTHIWPSKRTKKNNKSYKEYSNKKVSLNRPPKVIFSYQKRLMKF